MMKGIMSMMGISWGLSRINGDNDNHVQWSGFTLQFSDLYMGDDITSIHYINGSNTGEAG